LFVSQYAVQFFISLWDGGTRTGGKIAAIGKATSEALECAGIPVDLTPEDPSSEDLLCLPELQSPSLKGKTVTIFRGKSGRTLLDETLKQRGALVKEIVLYERVLPVWTKEDHELLMSNKIDLALGLSVDSLTYFFSQLDLLEKKRFLDVPWLIMSHRVAEEAKKLGIVTVYTVSKGDVLGSLIRSCSPGTIDGVL
jgi:uroporphyrinogen-III synthase